MAPDMWAGVELGGTHCHCVYGAGPHDLRARESLPTRDSATTLSAMADVLERWRKQFGAPSAIGIASFGPLDLRRDSPRYGRIGATPKPGWQDVDVLGFFTARFAVPVRMTTDVIGAALAEGCWGSGRGLSDFAYVTVGTGVGVGLIVAGRPALGCHHPELGHARIVRLAGDTWPGSCPFHGDCIEGLASGPAIEARGGTAAEQVSPESPVWRTVTHALAQLAHTLVVTVAPQRILMGGGVLNARPDLLPGIRQALAQSLNGYLRIAEVTSGLDRYIVPPGLGALAGPLGALAVAAGDAARV